MNNLLECKFCSKVCKNSNSLKNHERLCKNNPDRQISGLMIWNTLPKGSVVKYNQFSKAKKLGLPIPHYEITDETREKISKNNASHRPEIRAKISVSMKKAHAERRAHNIGECRWNNRPSYPEEWVIGVIKNEGLDISYIREYPFHRFSLDFAWVEKKKCLEVDGEQHEKDTEQKNRDKEKDKLLKEEGWQEMRVSWKYICNNTKEWIEEFKKFLK